MASKPHPIELLLEAETRKLTAAELAALAVERTRTELYLKRLNEVLKRRGWR